MLQFNYQEPEDRRLASIRPPYLHRVEIRTLADFDSFRWTVENQPAVREIALDLSVYINDGGSDTAEDVGDGVGESDPGPPVQTGNFCAHTDEVGRIISPYAVAALISSLRQVEALKLDGLRPAGLTIVLGETDPRSLASIKRLEVNSDDAHPNNVVAERVWIEELARLPALEWLSFAQERDGAQILPTLRVPPSLLHVTRLTLSGAGLVEPWDGPALCELVPRLVDLTIGDFLPHAWFASLLSTAPSGLRRLEMGDSGGIPVDEPASSPIDNILPRFEHLEHLHMCGSVLSTKLDSRLNCLRSLKSLRSLHLLGPIATDELLAGLLDDPRHLPRLERLGLSHVFGSKGSTVAGAGRTPGLSSHRWENWPMWVGWRAPEYPSGCTETGLRAAISVAEARRIVVEGSALEALEWRAAFEAEQRAAHLLFGDSTGDFGLARQVLGDAVVDEHLVERSRAQLESLGVSDGMMDVEM